ncbi:glycosyltransferase [Sphingomonas profundi]|uniref:glycosyltransferase n=1 Tax=Alterirhizorhabdus profundi TaxID=2681549 RepID=UPI0018D00FFC|nr:glycosyltransferase [Sphingomonas profundi]
MAAARGGGPGGEERDRRAHGAALAALGFAGRAAAILGPSETPAAPMPTAIDPAGIHVHLSTREARLDETDRGGLARRIGTGDYSYAFAMRGFIEGLARIGVPHTILPDPAGIADIRDRSPAACNIHLAFYPPEQLRLLKGAFNIACAAWEFDRLRLPAETLDPHAFADQATMLALPDMIWAPSAHGAGAIAASVATPVRTVPSPVSATLRAGGGLPTAERIAAIAARLAAISWQPLAIFPRLQGEMNHTADLHRHALADILAHAGTATPTIFVTVLNVHDYRKQIRPMLQGFAEFSRSRPDALLLVKSSTPARGVQPINSFLLAEQIFDVGELSRPLVSDRVWITDDVLTRTEMDDLYDVAGFYVCTSHAEGQNLPLLEAMGRGVVPVSVDHTAMADYVRPDNAVPIRSHRRPFDKRLSRRYGMFGLETHFVDPADVRAALAAAMALPPGDYAARAAAANATVRDLYGEAALLRALREAIELARRRDADG